MATKEHSMDRETQGLRVQLGNIRSCNYLIGLTGKPALWSRLVLRLITIPWLNKLLDNANFCTELRQKFAMI